MLILIIDGAACCNVGILREDNNDAILLVLEYSDILHRAALLCELTMHACTQL